MHDSPRSLPHDANPQQEPPPTGPKAATKQRPALALLREALTELHITCTCRTVAYELLSYWSPGGTVFPALQTMAHDTGLDTRTVRRHIKTLDRVGLWKRKRRTGQTNVYALHLPGEAQERFAKLSPRTPGSAPPGHQDPPKYPSEVPRAPTGRSAARPKNEGVRSTSTASSAPPHEAVASTPAEVREKSKRPNPPPFRLPDLSIWNATKDEAKQHIDAMREIARKARNGRQSSDKLPEPSADRREAALKTFADFDATMDIEREIERLPKKSVVSDRAEDCLHERVTGGLCELCGFDDGSSDENGAL